MLVTRITRADGTVLFNHEHRQTKVLEAGVVDTLTSILEQVIQRGTGTRAELDRPAAGKTGTADDNKDAWFAGYTPELATAVWVGFPQLGADRQLVPMRPPNTPFAVTGGSYPAEIWQHFMSAALAGRPVTPFAGADHHDDHQAVVAPPPRSRLGALHALARRPWASPSTRPRRSCARQASAWPRRPHPRGQTPPGTVVVQSPLPGQAPRDTLVTLEVATELDAKWTARRPPDEAARVTDHTTPRARRRPASRWTAGRVLAVVTVVLLVSMWGYVLYLAFGPGRQPPPDRLDDPAFATQAQAICEAAHDDVDQLPLAIDAEDAAERATIVAEANERFTAMLDELEAITPTGEDGAIVTAWIADWRTYLGDRAAYVDALRSDPGAQLLVTAKDREQVTEFIDAFSADNRMIACATPIDV